jgi:Rab-like protein 2
VQVTQKSFKFAEKHGCPFFFVSASDGTNVVRIFNEAILQGALLLASDLPF